MSAASIYVIGEVEERHGPVKIGMHYGPPSKSGRSGLSVGNWRTLEVLHHWELGEADVRWTEFLIHAHLQSRHVRGEWYRVRDLAEDLGGWAALLLRAYRQEVSGCEPVSFGSPGHRLARVRVMSWRPPREFIAGCECGFELTASKTTLPAVVRRFQTEHAS